jgi:DNA invertase Pin-like site-specific DNA recombinase
MATAADAHRFGYVRVSTRKQTVEQQIDALTAAGVPAEQIFGDVMSGAKWDRPGLSELKRVLRPGDELTVIALDRLGRSLSEMVTFLAWLDERGVVLRSLRESVDFSTPTGKMLAGIFGSLAEYERALILERAESARDAARARGRQVGRPAKLTAQKIDTAKALLAAGQSRAQVAETLGVSRMTIYRAIPA